MGLCDHQSAQGTLWIKRVDINRGMADVIGKGGKISGQLEGASGSHRVADEAFGIV